MFFLSCQNGCGEGLLKDFFFFFNSERGRFLLVSAKVVGAFVFSFTVLLMLYQTVLLPAQKTSNLIQSELLAEMANVKFKSTPWFNQTSEVFANVTYLEDNFTYVPLWKRPPRDVVPLLPLGKAWKSPKRKIVRRAIAVYFPGSQGMLAQLEGLRESWLYSCSAGVAIDLIIFHPEDADIPFSCYGPEHRVKDIPNCVQVEYEATDFKKYPFGHSISFLTSPEAAFIKDYDWLLRTDLDTFVTPRFVTWIPQGFAVSTHPGYSGSQEQQEKIHAVARVLGLRHRGLSNIGSSWYGRGAKVIEVAVQACRAMKYFLDHVFDGKRLWYGSKEGKWPEFSKSGIILYASEIAINHCVADLEFTTMLDGQSTHVISINEVAHIHTYQSTAMFSKIPFERGSYDRMNTQGFNLKELRYYALEMALRGKQVKKGPFFMHTHGLARVSTDIVRGHLYLGKGSYIKDCLNVDALENGNPVYLAQKQGEPWILREDGLLRKEQMCIEPVDDGQVRSFWCDGGLDDWQLWYYDSVQRLHHVMSGDCLTERNGSIIVLPCQFAQQWKFQV